MKDYSDIKIGSVGGTPLTVNDLLFHLKTNLDQTIIDDMVHAFIVRKAAEDLSITVSDAELQESADNFRKDMGLISAAETKEWLEESGLTIDEFERKIEDDLLKSGIENTLATDDKINQVFAENILDFEKVTIAKIELNDEGIAEEIKAQLDEGEADFASLAAKYSTDKETARKGGFAGSVNRSDLPDEVDVAVFAADASGIIGPIESDGSYHIINIIEPKKADPREEITRATIIKLIFDDYVTEKGQEIGVKLDFLS